MTTFLVAYAAVWLAVALYVLRLASRQRHLQQALEKLQADFDRAAAPSLKGSP